MADKRISELATAPNSGSYSQDDWIAVYRPNSSALNYKVKLTTDTVARNLEGLPEDDKIAQAGIKGLADALLAKADVTHSHNISDVTSLQSELDSKSDNGHGHTISDIVNLQGELNSKALASHQHGISAINGLQDALDAKSDTSHNHDAAYSAIDHNHDTDYASASHDHDSDYAALSHTHTIANVTGLQTALDGKAASSHSHAISDVTNLQSELDGKAAIGHNHDSEYASSNHNHDGDYASTSHNHDSTYAATNHNHDGVYAGASHNHDNAYQAVGSGVLSAGTYGSTSNQQKIDTITLDAEGHVTGIVTDDSTTLHTMHDDHGNTRHLRDYEHFKFSDASGVDVTLTTTATGSSTDPHILTIGHADTSSQTGIDNNDNIVIQSVGLDGFGHVTDLKIKQITPTLIGAAASSHNHDGTYLKDLSDDSSPTLGGALDANSNSITGITNLSANSIVMPSGGSLVSSASIAQNGSVSLTGMGTTGLNITSSAIGTNVPQVKFSDTGNSHEATIGFSGSTANVFKIEAENQDGTGQYAILEKDSSGNLIFRDSGNHSQSRLTTNNIWQLGYTGAHNGTDLVNGNDTGFQVNGAIGQAVIGSTHATAMKIASTGQTSPTMIHFYKNGSTAGTIKVSESGTTAYNTTSDLRLKSDIQDIENGVAKVCSLNPKSFVLNVGNGSRRAGLIAQDIDQNPHYGSDYVSRDEPTDDDPDPLMSLDYSSFVPDLIAAVKELTTRISKLEGT